MLHEVLDDAGIDAPVEDINVNDPVLAQSLRFPGSPTIRIDGRDIEPGFEDCDDCSPRCRLYATADGLRGVPERSWIEEAVAGSV
jgi:hypothetical protein